jgi:hypothetical protein
MMEVEVLLLGEKLAEVQDPVPLSQLTIPTQEYGEVWRCTAMAITHKRRGTLLNLQTFERSHRRLRYQQQRVTHLAG